MRTHHYTATVTWTGNLGSGTRDYRSYSRDNTLAVAGKPSIEASSDAAFRGDRSRWNPEDLLLASLSSCHMLWYLHLASTSGVAVIGYVDEAAATMELDGDGGGRFVRVTLRPHVTLAAGSDEVRAGALHCEAHAKCFIANSVNFPVHVEAATTVQ
ncbi:MAG: OsmC family protein [Candidatus Eremiobacteraeota bacterium]|nr:OsmC family protein [Candidatus Eremiobacteraeota bacterium]